MKRILTFGNPVYDMIVTPVLTRRDRVLSGCSTNACLAVSKLGEQGILIGTVGPDFRETLIRDLTSRGIEYNLVAAQQTGGFGLIYDARGDRELSILGIADPIPSSADGYQDVDFVLLGPILGEISPELVHKVKAKTQAPILLDPQGLLRGLKGKDIVHERTDAFVEIAKLCTIIKANELETEVVTGIKPRENPELAVKKLHDYGCKIAITTLADAGSIIYDGSTYYRIPAYQVNAVDPTGAGDTYAAGFMVKYLETPHDLSAVGCFGAAVASVMVENSGPDFPLTRAEADRRQLALLNSPMELRV